MPIKLSSIPADTAAVGTARVVQASNLPIVYSVAAASAVYVTISLSFSGDIIPATLIYVFLQCLMPLSFLVFIRMALRAFATQQDLESAASESGAKPTIQQVLSEEAAATKNWPMYKQLGLDSSSAFNVFVYYLLTASAMLASARRLEGDNQKLWVTSGVLHLGIPVVAVVVGRVLAWRDSR
ncbi:hypothetical protein HDV05_001835, partial [Chytridiales sp. JEL 0842]